MSRHLFLIIRCSSLSYCLGGKEWVSNSTLPVLGPIELSAFAERESNPHLPAFWPATHSFSVRL